MHPLSIEIKLSLTFHVGRSTNFASRVIRVKYLQLGVKFNISNALDYKLFSLDESLLQNFLFLRIFDTNLTENIGAKVFKYFNSISINSVGDLISALQIITKNIKNLLHALQQIVLTFSTFIYSKVKPHRENQFINKMLFNLWFSRLNGFISFKQNNVNRSYTSHKLLNFHYILFLIVP